MREPLNCETKKTELKGKPVGFKLFVRKLSCQTEVLRVLLLRRQREPVFSETPEETSGVRDRPPGVAPISGGTTPDRGRLPGVSERDYGFTPLSPH